jgi:TetR/AcrR family transcriptional regulator, cholesterol catabolism regulator
MQITETTHKQKEIREAAARLFRDKGYAATSMRDLAQAVDLKASSIYNHFESKEDILRQICFDNARRFLHGLHEIENTNSSSGEKLRALLHMHILIASEDLTSVTAFNDEWRHLAQPHLNDFIQIRKDYELRIVRIIEAGIACGELKPVNPFIAMHAIFSSMRWVYDWYKPGKKITFDDLVNDISTCLLHGILC